MISTLHTVKGKLIGKDEWAFGDFLADAVTHKQYIANMVNGHIKTYEVNPQTVQQSIDQLDVDGNEMFTNDIIRVFVNGYSFDGIIRYGNYTQKGKPYKTRTGLYLEWYEDSILGKCSNLEDIFSEVDAQYDSWILVLGNVIDNQLCDFDGIEIVPYEHKK